MKKRTEKFYELTTMASRKKEVKRTIVDDFKNMSLESKERSMETAIVETTRRAVSSPIPTPTSPHRNIVDDHFHQREKSVSPNPFYIRMQPEINDEDRHEITNWLVKTCYRLEIDNETLHLSINIMDRYMSEVKIARKKYLLVAITSLFIASKYQHDDHISTLDLLRITNNQYTYEQIIRTERHIMKVLNFDLGVGTAHHFLMLYIKAANDMEPQQVSIAEYLCDLAQVRVEFLVHSPSMIAASALRVVRDFYKLPWSADIICCSGYNKLDTNECAMTMLVQHTQWGAYKAVKRKYNKEQTHYASRIGLNKVMITVV